MPPNPPFSDVDRAIAFYRDKLGFHLDHDTQAGDQRFAQPPGSLKGVQLVVADAHRARRRLLERGVDVGDITVKDDRDGGTLFGFTDPDGNSWTVQQLKARAAEPLIPRR